jgi:hypothetical protein
MTIKKLQELETRRAMFCTYDVIPRSICVISVVVESNNVTYSECVSLFLTQVIRHAKRMRRTTLSFCGLSASTVLFHIISQTARFT